MTSDEFIQIKFYGNAIRTREIADDDLSLFFNSINRREITFGDEMNFIINVGILADPSFEGCTHDLANQLHGHPSLALPIN